MLRHSLKVRNVRILATTFFIYFVRKILAFGLLRSPIVRIGLLLLTALALVIMTVTLLTFFGQFSGSGEMLFLIEFSSISTISWSLAMFIFVKVLFMKSGGLLRFTLPLPVSHRERTAAMTLYETALVIGAASVLFLPLAATATIELGFAVLPSLSANMLMPTITCYLLLALAYAAGVSLLLRLGLIRLTHPILLILLTVAMLWYNSLALDLGNQLGDAFLNGTHSFIGVNLFSHLLLTAGAATTFFIFLLATIAIFILTLYSSPRQYPEARKFIRTRIPFPSSRIWPTVTAFSRRADWWIVVVLTYIAAAMLFATDTGPTFIYTPCLLLSQGIYAFSGTAPLRRLPGYWKSAAAEVTHLLTAQAVVIAAFALPVVIPAVFRPEAFTALPMMAAALFSGIITTTLIGIVMMPEHDNPIAAFTGYAVAIAVLVSLIAIMGVLQPPLPVFWGSVAAINLLAVFYSVVTVTHIERRNKYASVNAAI